MELSIELAALVAGSSLTLAGILVAVLGFIQMYYAMEESLRDQMPQEEFDIAQGRRLFQVIRSLSSLTAFLSRVKIIAVAFMACFFLSLVWLILIESQTDRDVLWWYSRITIGFFVLTCIFIVWTIWQIKIERKPE